MCPESGISKIDWFLGRSTFWCILLFFHFAGIVELCKSLFYPVHGMNVYIYIYTHHLISSNSNNLRLQVVLVLWLPVEFLQVAEATLYSESVLLTHVIYKYLLMGFAISFGKHQEHLQQQFKNVILTSDWFCQVKILSCTHMMQLEQQWRNLLFSNASYCVSTPNPSCLGSPTFPVSAVVRGAESKDTRWSLRQANAVRGVRRSSVFPCYFSSLWK